MQWSGVSGKKQIRNDEPSNKRPTTTPAEQTDDNSNLTKTRSRDPSSKQAMHLPNITALVGSDQCVTNPFGAEAPNQTRMLIPPRLLISYMYHLALSRAPLRWRCGWWCLRRRRGRRGGRGTAGGRRAAAAGHYQSLHQRLSPQTACRRWHQDRSSWTAETNRSHRQRCRDCSAAAAAASCRPRSSLGHFAKQQTLRLTQQAAQAKVA
jgi:hypothetical protein